jgi:MFS family permease
MLAALGERDFRLLWLGQAASAFGSSLVPVALAFAVVDLTASAAALGLVLSVGLGSRVCLLLLGGVVADRLPRERVMLAAEALRCSTQAVGAALLLTGSARVWELLVLFALLGAGDAFFSPASTSLVPETVPAIRLQQANALIGVARNAARVAGPVLAGLIVAAGTPGIAFAIDAVTFAVSGMSLGLLRLPGTVHRAADAGVLAELRDGWREVSAHSWICTMVAQFALSNLLSAPLFVLGPFVAERSLGGAAAWGVVGTCGGIGAVLGNVLALRLKPSRPLCAGCMAVSLCAVEPALLAWPFPTAAIAAAALAGFGAVSFSNALWFTVLQERIPGEALARVSSYDWLGSLVFQPAGYALAAPAAAAIGISETLLVGAAAQASMCIGVALTPAVRSVRVGERQETEVRKVRGRPGAKSEACPVMPARGGS